MLFMLFDWIGLHYRSKWTGPEFIHKMGYEMELDAMGSDGEGMGLDGKTMGGKN